MPKTDFGQTVRQLNLIARDVRLLTQALSDGQGKLNPNGSLQKMVLRGDLYDNINRMTTTVTDTFNGFRPVLALLRIFAEKISRDPSLIARGAATLTFPEGEGAIIPLLPPGVGGVSFFHTRFSDRHGFCRSGHRYPPRDAEINKFCSQQS